MQYLGGKAGPGFRIAQLCSERLGPDALFVDMFCGSLNVVRHVPTPRRLAVDACGPLMVMWRAALRGWVPPTEVSREEYERIKEMQDPDDPLTAFVLFGCSFGGKWCGGYAKNRPTQRYAEHASHQVVAKARDCIGTVLEHADFREKYPGDWPAGTVLYCDPPYAGTTGYKALESFYSGPFWLWAGEHAQRGVHVFVSEYRAPEGWKLVDEQVATQAGRLTPGAAKEKRVDRLFYRGS
jgi:DNA adenine methylase